MGKDDGRGLLGKEDGRGFLTIGELCGLESSARTDGLGLLPGLTGEGRGLGKEDGRGLLGKEDGRGLLRIGELCGSV